MDKIDTKPMPILLTCACEIAAAYVSKNYVSSADLPALVRIIYASLTERASVTLVQEIDLRNESKLSSAQIRASIKPEALVSFLDGKSYKTLKRHLSSRGFTPETYREQFGLASDYPMVAPSYSSRRSVLAKEIGLRLVAGRSVKHRVK